MKKQKTYDKGIVELNETGKAKYYPTKKDVFAIILVLMGKILPIVFIVLSVVVFVIWTLFIR